MNHSHAEAGMIHLILNKDRMCGTAAQKTQGDSLCFTESLASCHSVRYEANFVSRLSLFAISNYIKLQFYLAKGGLLPTSTSAHLLYSVTRALHRAHMLNLHPLLEENS